MCLLGCDIGSSSIKVSIVDEETGLTIGADFYPKEEAPIKALRPGWAEQNPEDWWSYVKIAMKGAMSKAKVKGEDIKAIGISYQMHGLVVVDKKMEVLRPSIIWCDSRAVPYGERAFKNNRFAGFERAPLALNGPLAREQDEAARTVSAVACRKLV